MDSVGEKTFPRGGRNLAFFKSKKNDSASLFKKPKKQKKKENKDRRYTDKKDIAKKTVKKTEGQPLNPVIVENLTSSGVQEDLLFLAMVSQISDKIISMSLPGSVRGIVTLPNVSEFYKNMIENMNSDIKVPHISEMFEIGQIYPVKILSSADKKDSFMLSMDPKLINEKLTYNMIEEGFILFGTVKSEEDHGYIIDFGIDHISAFLHFDKVDSGREIQIGQILQCAVIECNITRTVPGSCSVQLSTLKKDIQSSFISKNSSLPVFSYIPGFQFQVTIKKKLREGVEVDFGTRSSTKGYIHEDYFAKKFPKDEDVKVGSEFIATLLYVKPLVNFPYFKVMPKTIEWPFRRGEIVCGKVAKAKRSGVVFRIADDTRKAKCFVPFNKLSNSDKIVENKLEILNYYTINRVIPKIRLAGINYMAGCYIGTTDKASIEAKYYTYDDIKCGEVVSCTILSFKKSDLTVEISKGVIGIVPSIHVADVPLANPKSKFQVGRKVQARVLYNDSERHIMHLTMKPTLVKEKEILSSYEDCVNGRCYTGTVIKVLDHKIVVSFFNKIKGSISNKSTPYPDSLLQDHFTVGELVKCYVVSCTNHQIHLSLFSTEQKSSLNLSSLEPGKFYEGTMANRSKTGLLVDVQTDKKGFTCKGYLPTQLLSLHSTLNSCLHSTYSEGDKISVYCITNNLSGTLPLLGVSEAFSFFKGKSEEDIEEMVTPGAIVPFMFLKNEDNKTMLTSIIPGKQDYAVKLAFKVDEEDCLPFPKSNYQVVCGKILACKEKKLLVSVKLNDVWDKDFYVSLKLLNSYLRTMGNLVKRQRERQNLYNDNIDLGHPVSGVIEEVKTKCGVLRTETGDLALVYGKFSQGQEIAGSVVWIDGPQQMVFVRPIFELNEESDAKKVSSIKPDSDNLRAKVVHICDELVVVRLRGRGAGKLAFIPRRRHLNDVSIGECTYALGDELKVWITREDSDHILAMDRRIISVVNNTRKKSHSKLENSVSSLKRKLEMEKIERHNRRKSLSDSDDIHVVDQKIKKKSLNGNLYDGEIEIKEEMDVDDFVHTTSNGVPQLEYDDVEIKSEEEDIDDKNTSQLPSFKRNNEERIMLSSSSESEDEDEDDKENMKNSNPFKVGFNWNVLNNNSLLSGIVFKKDESSSDDEDDETKNEKKKRSRLSAHEREEKAKTEEQRLRLIEERLMSNDREPETVDDFDRAVLSNPDSSALWLKYMAFHIQNTEIEKARAVARRALKAISFRQEQEKLNVWIALLNLENMYGNDESLNRILTEALQSNDPYKIHLHMFNVHGQGNKLQEMEKSGNMIMKKYKDVDTMWIDVGSAYFAVGKLESARNVLQKALVNAEKSKHVLLISKFAHLENKHGSPERAQTLYESILSSFPKRVDVWCSYVDMLVKSNNVELARQVLERATAQSLRPRKMKTLFKKFIAFEEAHGTSENVDKVREAAVEYVQTIGSLDD